MSALQKLEKAVLDEVCPAGEAWMCEVKKDQYFRIVDLEGNQAVDTLFISAENPDERYSATDTLAQNQQIYLEKGTVLFSNYARPIAVIVDDNCGRHDTLGGRVLVKVIRCAMHMISIQCIVVVIILCMP